MPLCRFIIKPTSPWSTPLRSDTLAGMLLYRMAEDEGEKIAKDTIELFRSGSIPFAVSSAMPHNFVPMPKMPAISPQTFRELFKKGHFIDGSITLSIQAMKKFRKLRYVPLSVWSKVCGKLSPEKLFEIYCSKKSDFSPPQMATLREPHVSISRNTSTVLDKGFYFREATCFEKNMRFDLYAITDSPDVLLQRICRIGELGFGKDASSGRGMFSAVQDDTFTEILVPNAIHSMLLSMYAMQEYQPLDGWYSTEVKIGKAGPVMVDSPFKAPFLCLQEGSVIANLSNCPVLIDKLHVNSNVVQVFAPVALPCHVEINYAK